MIGLDCRETVTVITLKPHLWFFFRLMVTSVVKGIVISKTLFYITVFINKKVLVNILNYIIFKGTLWE